MITEADTCRKYVLPKLLASGWDADPHSFTGQKTFTDGRIVVTGSKVRRRPQKRADYLLRHTRNFPTAVVEAKAAYRAPGAGLQQAKDYAEILSLPFAYSTNDPSIIKYSYLSGLERELTDLPNPEELWTRLRAQSDLTGDNADKLLSPSYDVSGKSPRYYQEIAINRTMKSMIKCNKRILLTMATGTGKTGVAYFTPHSASRPPGE